MSLCLNMLKTRVLNRQTWSRLIPGKVVRMPRPMHVFLKWFCARQSKTHLNKGESESHWRRLRPHVLPWGTLQRGCRWHKSQGGNSAIRFRPVANGTKDYHLGNRQCRLFQQPPRSPCPTRSSTEPRRRSPRSPRRRPRRPGRPGAAPGTPKPVEPSNQIGGAHNNILSRQIGGTQGKPKTKRGSIQRVMFFVLFFPPTWVERTRGCLGVRQPKKGLLKQ